jgi:hypothetical protein
MVLGRLILVRRLVLGGEPGRQETNEYQEDEKLDLS